MSKSVLTQDQVMRGLLIDLGERADGRPRLPLGQAVLGHHEDDVVLVLLRDRDPAGADSVLDRAHSVLPHRQVQPPQEEDSQGEHQPRTVRT